MNIFKTWTLTWWQAAIFKICLLSIGVAIGSTWPAVFASYALILAFVGVVLGCYLAYAWFQ